MVGLLPTGYGWGGFDPFVAPMALALGWGLAFATFVTLFALPAALAVLNDVTVVTRRNWAKLIQKLQALELNLLVLLESQCLLELSAPVLLSRDFYFLQVLQPGRMHLNQKIKQQYCLLHALL